MLTATCFNCGAPKQPAQYADNFCTDCTAAQKGGEDACAKENPEATHSQIIYEGRRALTARAHHAHRNFVDPRALGGSRGMIPIPPAGERTDAR